MSAFAGYDLGSSNGNTISVTLILSTFKNKKIANYACHFRFPDAVLASMH